MESTEGIPTVSAAQLRDIFQELQNLGLSAGKIFEVTKVEESDFSAIDGRIDVVRARNLWDLLRQTSGDPLYAFKIGQVVSQGSMGLLANLVLSCATMGEALDTSIRFFKLVNEVDEISFETSGQFMAYIYTNKIPKHYNVCNVDRSISAAVAWVKLFTVKDIYPLEIRFQYPEPKHGDQIRDFFNCPIRFSQERNELIYDAVHLLAKNPRRNDYLNKLLETRARKLFADLPTNQDLTQKLKAILSEALPSGDVNLDIISSQLHMSRATLYRKLKELGTSFQTVQEELRRELSEFYLDDMEFTQQETAFMLGFSEVSAFSRAYKRWFGKPPGKRKLSEKTK